MVGGASPDETRVVRQIPSALAAHLQGELSTLAVCWRVGRRDGVLILGTEHDQDVTIGEGGSPPNPYAGTYVAQAGITGSSVRSTSDMSVDNMEVEGAVTDGDLQLVDLTAADIEAGLLDDAAVTLFLVNWASPDDGQIVLRTGNIGEIRRTAEGQYRTELRGLAQRLSQTIGRTYGSSCDAELGDSRCKVDIDALTVTGEVLEVTDNRRFRASIEYGSPAAVMDLELYLAMPRDIVVGDTFTIQPGCDKSLIMCRERFSNLVNFRGHGFWTPGIGNLSQFGGQTPAASSGSIFGGEIIQRLLQEWLANHPFPAQSLGSPDSPWFEGGLVRFTSGDNESFSMEVKRSLPAP